MNMRIKQFVFFQIPLILLVVFLTPLSGSAFDSYKRYSKLPEPPATSLGESFYRESDCAMCHGELGDGEGFLAVGLDPKPRDFTNFMQMARIPDQQMEEAIRKGIKGTAMPAHPGFSDEQIRELIVYIKSLLAETYVTINLCFSATHVIDIGEKGLGLEDFKIKVDHPDLVEVKKVGNKVHISSNTSMQALKFLMKRKVTRTHVKLIEKDFTLSMIAVRLHRCLG